VAGVDLLSKLELESERNLLHYYAMYSSLALHYVLYYYDVHGVHEISITHTTTDCIRPLVFGRVLNCRQLALLCAPP
jgi:hypothetical protein